jgi:hypothetical protein
MPQTPTTRTPRKGRGWALLAATLLGSVDRARSGVASGTLSTARQSGSVIGVALFGSLIAGGLVAGLRLALLVSIVLALIVVALTSGIDTPSDDRIPCRNAEPNAAATGATWSRSMWERSAALPLPWSSVRDRNRGSVSREEVALEVFDGLGGNSNLAVAGPAGTALGEIGLDPRIAIQFALSALPSQEALNLVRALHSDGERLTLACQPHDETGHARLDGH